MNLSLVSVSVSAFFYRVGMRVFNFPVINSVNEVARHLYLTRDSLNLLIFQSKTACDSLLARRQARQTSLARGK